MTTKGSREEKKKKGKVSSNVALEGSFNRLETHGKRGVRWTKEGKNHMEGESSWCGHQGKGGFVRNPWIKRVCPESLF